MHMTPSVQSVCWFVFDPKWAAVNDLNSVWSSTSLCGTPVGIPNPLHEAMTSQWSNLRTLLSLTLLSTTLIFQAWRNNGQWQSGNRARTCNDYSDSLRLDWYPVLQAERQGTGTSQAWGAKFLLKVRATRYSIITDCNYESSCWAHYWASNELGPTYMRVRF